MSRDIQQLATTHFPPLIHEMADSPKSLYVQGTLPSRETKLLAVVGSRKCTSYGRDVVDFLLEGLRGYDISIVSGLALGIDGHAHAAALRSGLHTIAVPGSGLSESVLYPQSHAHLARQILEHGGALLSEFEPEERAAPWTFPKRNRIMAGMSHAILVIEATERSGTLITARLATEYNRDLLVVPGSIFAQSSKGAHQFLKLGATPVTTSKDILVALGFSLEEQEDEPTVDFSNFSKQECEILELLANPMSRDELLSQLSFSVTEANILLSKLELDGVIVEKLGTLRRA
ncbi:MAG: DNA-protecting protein DprA [Candidatus Pacebacteria bacterium]|nr:DNA-protecting protein DprA [Candidatus Paceibacterota bacterium]